MHFQNYIYFLIITLLGAKLLFQKQGKVKHPLRKGKYLLFDGPELFWVLTFSTGLMAFSAPGTLDLMAIRLLVLEVFCIIGLFIVKRKPVWNFTTLLYLTYLLWLIIGTLYSPSPMYGFRVLLKYLYPFLIMFFASAVIRHKEIFIKAGLGARTIALICLFFSFIPFVGKLIPGVFWYGTAQAINYIVICIFSLTLYYYGGKEKKDITYAILFMLPCIIWVLRTSIMGTTLALIVFFFFKYKAKSLPVIFGVLMLFLVAVFAIPSVKEKMFFKTEGKNVEQLRSGEISMDDINSNGRFAMWGWALDNFYHNKELIGTGTGNLQEVFYSLQHPFGTIRICHNDYVQILCDNGLIGVFLFGGSFIFLIGHCFIVFQRKKYDVAIRMCAIIAGASSAGVLLTMYTDNVINYSMATLSYPCGFYGMMLGLIEGYKRKKAHAV